MSYPYKLTVKIDGKWYTAEGDLPDGDDDRAPFEDSPNRAAVKPPTSSAPPATRSGPPSRDTSGSSWKDGAPDCDHGRMRPHEGQYKSGKNVGQSYKAFFCASPQGTPDHEKCKPVWV